MLDNVEAIHHSSIKINNVFIDPFELNEDYDNADYIFITHSHYDHYSEEDIVKVKKAETKIIITIDLKEKVEKLGLVSSNIIIVEPNKKYTIDKLKVETIPAYNNEKPFHPKYNKWVGYILETSTGRFYIAGDTDITAENKKINCDIAFLPIGGTYTMNYKEAAELANIINPKIVIPVHYGSIIGLEEDTYKFKELINKTIRCKILIN